MNDLFLARRHKETQRYFENKNPPKGVFPKGGFTDGLKTYFFITNLWLFSQFLRPCGLAQIHSERT